MISALVGLACAAPAPDVSSHVVNHGHGAVVAHGVHQAHHGAHAVAHGLVPVAHHGAHHGLVAHPVAHHGLVAHPVAHHGLVAHPVAHHGLAHPIAHVAHPIAHAPIVHHAPVVHAAPAYAPAPAYVEPVGKDEPYSYQYGVADDYSKANFNAAETADGAGVVTGSYDVALPDGRTQHVKYTSDHINGYVAEVTYEGVPVYPEAKPYVPAPAPAYHA